MAGKLTALGRLIALIALPGQYRLVKRDRVIPEGYKLCPPGSKVVPIVRGFKKEPKEPLRIEIVREDRP
jgi:hypothetical protein